MRAFRQKYLPLILVSCRDNTYIVSKNTGFSSLKNMIRLSMKTKTLILTVTRDMKNQTEYFFNINYHVIIPFARPLVAWLVQELMFKNIFCLICFDFARFLRVSALLFPESPAILSIF